MARKDQSGTISIGDWNFSGLSYSKFMGTKNSLHKMVGLNPHDIPGVLTVEQKMTKNSGDTVTELCKVAVNCSNNIRYWFSSQSGKIWQEKTGTYTLVYTTSAAAGASLCLGAQEYQGYLYFATQSRLHRIAIASADGAAAWTANIAANWATFTKTDADFHPMISHSTQLTLYIGDGNQLAQVEVTADSPTGLFSANALDLKTPLRIKSLGEMNTDILIGTYIADTIADAQIIRWNGWSVSFFNPATIAEIGVNCFLPMDGFVLVQAGNKGNLYYYNGETFSFYMKIPGSYSSTAYGEVYPYSVANREGQILFGFSNGSGNPADQLIYRIARHNKDFGYILDQPYPISERSSGEFVLTGLNIGAILVVGSDVYVSWKNGSSYGIDKLDTTTKLDGAYLESRVMLIDRETFSNLSQITVAYATKPENTNVSIYLDRNYAGYGSALTTLDDVDRKIIQTKDEQTNFTTLQAKFKVTTSVNSTPQIEGCKIFIQ